MLAYPTNILVNNLLYIYKRAEIITEKQRNVLTIYFRLPAYRWYATSFSFSSMLHYIYSDISLYYVIFLYVLVFKILHRTKFVLWTCRNLFSPQASDARAPLAQLSWEFSLDQNVLCNLCGNFTGVVKNQKQCCYLQSHI